jgi:hypothetical protein
MGAVEATISLVGSRTPSPLPRWEEFPPGAGAASASSVLGLWVPLRMDRGASGVGKEGRPDGSLKLLPVHPAQDSVLLFSSPQGNQGKGEGPQPIPSQGTTEGH